MSDYQKLKARAQLLQAQRDAEVKRELAEKKEKELAAAKDVEARAKQSQRRRRLEEAAAQLRREELKAANAALTAAPVNGSTATRVEYDPFAEDDLPASSVGPSQSKLKIGPNGRVSATSMRGAAANGSSVKREPRQPTGSGSTKDRRKEKESTPPLLGRKERAARAFAMQIKKQAKSDSLFSVRNLVETDARGSSSTAPHTRPQPQNHRPNPTSQVSATSKKLSAPGKKGAAAVDELRKLAPGRAGWDRRSIDEIQRDIRAAKIKPEAVSTGMSRTKSAESVNGIRIGAAGGVKRPKSTSPSKAAATTPIAKSRPKPPPIPSTARPSHSTSIGSKRTRSPSTSSSSSSTSSVHRFAVRRPRWEEDDLAPADVSATIQGLFRRPGGRPPPVKYADSDASSDMEAGMSDVEEEERRAARIARLEDEKAEREERERKERKERLKREKMRGR